MDVEQFEIEIVEFADGSGRADYYRVDETGRYFERSTPLTASDVRVMRNAARDDTEDTSDEL